MRKMFTVALLLALTASGVGCRMCADCNDELGPVINGPYAYSGLHNRAGSAFGGEAVGPPAVIGDEEVIYERTPAVGAAKSVLVR